MWLLTTFGFFSVVARQSDPSTLQVRARDRKDLETFRERYLGDTEREILELAGTDYEYRLYASHEEVASAVAAAIGDIDYSNFKSAVAQRQGYARAGVYGSLWSELLNLSDRRTGRH
jgi:hypothetical protein